MAKIIDKKKTTTKKVPAVNRNQQKAKSKNSTSLTENRYNASKTSNKLVPLKENTPKEKRQTARKVKRAKKELGWDTGKKTSSKKDDNGLVPIKEISRKEKKEREKKRAEKQSNLVPLEKYKVDKKARKAAQKVAKTASSGITPRTSLTENRYNASKPSNKLVPIPEYSASEQRQRDRKIKRAKKELGWD